MIKAAGQKSICTRKGRTGPRADMLGRSLLVLLITLVTVYMTAMPAEAFTGYEPGVTDTKMYREIVLLGGAPAIYSGTAKVSSKVKKDIAQTTITYKLTSSSGESLTRSVKLESKLTTRDKQDVYKPAGWNDGDCSGRDRKAKAQKGRGILFQRFNSC
jgi:hypothetical protein